MSSEEISKIAVSPFIRKFTFAVIKSIQSKNLSHEEKHVIHADLVPKVSNRVMQASLGERTTPRIIRRIAPRQNQILRTIRPKNIVTPYEIQNEPSQNYGKITPLLNDPSVSTIECRGVGKPIIIIRAGQKQITKIILSADDIKTLLRNISDRVHIPLLEGVFRAAVDNFSINAVISEMIGSRFIIKKQTAYTMLER